MSNVASYQTETHKAYIGSNEITVIGISPVFATEEDRVSNKKNIESNLYHIFVKYSHN